jgi:hypothetical protein
MSYVSEKKATNSKSQLSQSQSELERLMQYREPKNQGGFSSRFNSSLQIL